MIASKHGWLHASALRHIAKHMSIEEQTQSITLERAGSSAVTLVEQLLERSGLPREGFAEHVGTSVVARKNGDRAEIVGNATLELYGRYALLRSVAVDERERGHGLGQRLTGAALDLARERGVRAVFLLTETAGEFFPRFGFRPVRRDNVPDEVLQSVEFRTLCPTSALVMKLDLAGAQSGDGSDR